MTTLTSSKLSWTGDIIMIVGAVQTSLPELQALLVTEFGVKPAVFGLLTMLLGLIVKVLRIWYTHGPVLEVENARELRKVGKRGDGAVANAAAGRDSRWMRFDAASAEECYESDLGAPVVRGGAESAVGRPLSAAYDAAADAASRNAARGDHPAV